MSRILEFLRYLAEKGEPVDVVSYSVPCFALEDVCVSFDHDFVSFEAADHALPCLAILELPVDLVTHIDVGREATVVFVGYTHGKS